MKVLEIITAEKAGFCFGVERAIDMAKNASTESPGPVYTLGPIIHNPQVVSKLEQRGIKVIASIDEIDRGTLIIRSHGIKPEKFKKARDKGLNIIDATCPFVKKAQKYAHKLVEDGYQTFIFGDKDHPEVKGIHGSTKNTAFIIDNPEKLKDIDIEEKVGIVAQTTQSPQKYNKIISHIIPESKEIKVFNTICNTTETRQKAAVNLAEKVDVMMVIGGYNSANTNRLAEICRNTGTPTHHIETAAELDQDWFHKDFKVGITAGASTPDWLIKEVIEAMKEENQEKNITNEVGEDVEEINENVEETVDENLEETTAADDTAVEAETAEVEEEEADIEETAAASAEEAEEDEIETEAAEETAETEEEVEEEEVEIEDSEETAEINYSDNDIADLKKGQKVTGTIVELKDDGIYVDVGYKTEGFIPLRELSHRKVDDPGELVETDEEIEVVILTLEDEEGNMILSKKQADYEKAWEDILEAFEDDEIIEAEVTKEVKGGLVVDVGVRGFIPASHVAIGYVEDLSQYVGETLRLKVIEVERDKNNVVLSAKKVLEEERAQEKEETLAALEEGQTVEGKVTKLVDFGAFIDLGGIEGLLHISEMSWGRIDHPSDVLEEGQNVEVKVLGVNREKERISLGLKQLLPDPWEEFAEKHYEGEIIDGTITKIVDFGAFMEIETGIEGLIHISQLSHKHVKTPDEVVTVGEERQAKIINIDAEQKRVGLSLKELEEDADSSSGEEDSRSEAQNSGSAGDSQNEEEDTPSGATIGELVGDIFNDEEE